MHLPLRVRGDGGATHDVRVAVPEHCTVGELADALASATGSSPGGTVVARWPTDDLAAPPRRGETVAAAGPRAGSTVEIVTEAEADHPPRPAASPVALIHADGTRHHLPYGPTPIDRAVIDIATSVEVASRGGSDVLVNGATAHARTRVVDGDLLRIGGHLWTVSVTGPLYPPTDRGPWVAHRSSLCPSPILTSAHRPFDDRPAIVLPTPPGASRLPGLPVLTATVPLLMGLGMWLVTRSLLTSAFAMFSFVFVVAAGIESRREARAEERFRRKEYDADLSEAQRRLANDAAVQVRTLERGTPSTPEVIAWQDPTHAEHHRLWERSRDPSRPARPIVRLGVTDIERGTRIDVGSSGRRDLRRELERIAEEATHIDGPLVVDLARTGGLAIVGDGEAPADVARAVVVQLCSTVAAADLCVEVVADTERDAVWGWTQWLPHAVSSGASIRLLIVDGHGTRVAGPPPAASGSDTSSEAATAAPTLRIWTGDDLTAVPGGLSAVVDLRTSRFTLLAPPTPPAAVGSPADTGHHLPDQDRPVPDRHFELRSVEAIGTDEALLAARLMCAMTQRSREAGAVPGTVGLRDVLADPRCLQDERLLAAQWQRSGPLVAPIGLTGDHAVLDLDLVADGPHALVAGTTGAGKSELLRTLLISLALHHPPDELSFLLVDYKGGAAFGPIADLPHTVGMVTDLTPLVARRALLSLSAELRHRERWLADRGIDDLRSRDAEAEPDRPASLVIVVDEFATMAREIPDFVDGLVDVAQRGRSLGIHLVLATQRPAGVVTDAIRANTGIRIALRVTDDEDSRDVVDTADAAHLPRDAPGRAIVRTGPSHRSTVQVAHTGSTWEDAPGVVVEPLTGAGTTSPSPAADGPSELATAISTIRRAARTSDRRTARRPWVEPLPSTLAPGSLIEHRNGAPEPVDVAGSGGIPIGLVDRPERQRLEELTFEPVRDRGIAVIGASGSGRTTAMLAVASMLTAVDATARVVALGSGPELERWRDVGVLSDSISLDDVERVHRALRMSLAELDRRRGGNDDRSPFLLMVDGLASFEELHGDLARGVAPEMVLRLAREGPSVGLHVLVTAHRASELTPALAACLGMHLYLRPASEDEATMLDLPADAAGPDIPAGRCWIRGTTAQLVLPDPSPRADAPTATPWRVHRAPLAVRLQDLDRVSASRSGRGEHDDRTGTRTDLELSVGVDVDSLAPVVLELAHHALVIGPPRSGRTAALRLLAAQLERSGHEVTSLDADTDPPTLAARLDDLALESPAPGGRRPALIIDDLPLILDVDHTGEIEHRLSAVLAAGRAGGPHVVASGEATALTHCYSDAVRRMRAGRTGVLLGAEGADLGDLLHSGVTPRPDVPGAPGRGWVVSRGRSTLSQLALG